MNVIGESSGPEKKNQNQINSNKQVNKLPPK